MFDKGINCVIISYIKGLDFEVRTRSESNAYTAGLRILARMIGHRYMQRKVTQTSDQEKHSHSGSLGEEANNQSWHKTNKRTNHGRNQH